MNELLVEDFNLFHTLDSGQIFTYYKKGKDYIVLANNAVFKLRQEGKKLFYSGKKLDTTAVTSDDVKKLFGLDIDQTFEITDPFIERAAHLYQGMKIMKQDPYDTTIAFIISQMNNIPRITTLANVLLEHSSRIIEFEGLKYKLFPSPEELPSEEELKILKFGYRSKYISGLKVKASVFNNLESQEYSIARNMLLELNGIGPKVADCILLFSCQKFNSFPVDTHIIKFMKSAFLKQLENTYNKKIDDITQKQIEEFGKTMYGNKSGIIQQFLFQYARKNL